MDRPDKIFSLSDFVYELNTDIETGELSWDFQIDCRAGVYSVRTGRMKFMVNIFIKLFGSRQPWVKERVIQVAEKHGLEVTRVPDFQLYGSFTDILGARGG